MHEYGRTPFVHSWFYSWMVFGRGMRQGIVIVKLFWLCYTSFDTFGNIPKFQSSLAWNWLWQFLWAYQNKTDLPLGMPRGIRLFDTVYNLNHANNCTMHHIFISRCFDFRFTSENTFTSLFILCPSHSCTRMNCNFAAQVCFPASIFYIFPSMDNRPCPRLTNSNCLHRNLLYIFKDYKPIDIIPNSLHAIIRLRIPSLRGRCSSARHRTRMGKQSQI